MKTTCTVSLLSWKKTAWERKLLVSITFANHSKTLRTLCSPFLTFCLLSSKIFRPSVKSMCKWVLRNIYLQISRTYCLLVDSTSKGSFCHKAEYFCRTLTCWKKYLSYWTYFKLFWLHVVKYFKTSPVWPSHLYGNECFSTALCERWCSRTFAFLDVQTFLYYKTDSSKNSNFYSDANHSLKQSDLFPYQSASHSSVLKHVFRFFHRYCFSFLYVFFSFKLQRHDISSLKHQWSNSKAA